MKTLSALGVVLGVSAAPAPAPTRPGDDLASVAAKDVEGNDPV